MKGTLQELINALKPLGEHQIRGKQIKFNCKQCELDGNPINKFNLEIEFTESKKRWHCWCCNESGSLYKLIEKYGYPEYLPLFKGERLETSAVPELNIKLFALPDNLISASRNAVAFSYLKSRNVTYEQIKHFQIKYCYDGPYKNHIIFPSYNAVGRLVCYVSHSLSTKQYKTHKHKDFICFWENQIDKNSQIIITEGIYDALSLPNAIPLLGLGISDVLIEWLTEQEVLVVLDSVVNKKTQTQIEKKLLTVTDKVRFCKIPKEYEDSNDIAIKANNELISLLQTFY